MRVIINLILLSLGFACLAEAQKGRCCRGVCGVGVCSTETCGDGKGCEGPNFNTCCPDPKDWGSFEAPMTT
ncbi:hypothetical protein LA080_007635 [Diaporthe eres]|nr:hypothetical protein LA080_007635 [Diaporthe eres]